MSKGDPTPPSAGAGANAACNSAVQSCPLGDLIVHVREDTSGGTVIQGAAVTISGPESGSGTSDAADKAEFLKVQPGTYTVKARKDKYSPDPATASATVPSGGKTEVTLVLKAHKVIQIKAKVPGTNGVRKPATDKRADNTLAASSSKDESLSTNKPVILVRGCKDVELEAVTDPPNKPVTWQVKSNENTDAPPSITPTDGGKKAKLKSNVHGSFSVIATLGSTKVVWNVVFVWVKVDTTSSSVTIRDSKYADGGSGGGWTVVRSGQFSAGNYAWEASVKVKVVGGGNSKRLGTDKVKVRVLQNGVGDTLTGNYTGGGTALEVPKGGLPVVDATGPGLPFITNTTAASVTPNDTDFERTVWSGDSPAGAFRTTHKNAGTALASISGQNSFKTAVASVSDDAPNSIVAHAKIAWQADFSGSVAATGAYTKTTAATTSDPRFQRISDSTGGQDADTGGFETFEPRFNGGVNTTWNL